MNSGWASEERNFTLPNRILLIPGTTTLPLITPIAKKIPLGLWLAYMYYKNDMELEEVLNKSVMSEPPLKGEPGRQNSSIYGWGL